jgi:hypothetical protein
MLIVYTICVNFDKLSLSLHGLTLRKLRTYISMFITASMNIPCKMGMQEQRSSCTSTSVRINSQSKSNRTSHRHYCSNACRRLLQHPSIINKRINKDITKKKVKIELPAKNIQMGLSSDPRNICEEGPSTSLDNQKGNTLFKDSY